MSEMLLHVRANASQDYKQAVVDEWLRYELKKALPPLIEKWQPIMGVEVKKFFVQKMKTRWGTCNVKARRIWLSLELAKKPLGFLESTVVHEMVHLLERGHNKKFYGLMDQFMPEWQIWDKKKTEV